MANEIKKRNRSDLADQTEPGDNSKYIFPIKPCFV